MFSDDGAVQMAIPGVDARPLAQSPPMGPLYALLGGQRAQAPMQETGDDSDTEYLALSAALDKVWKSLFPTPEAFELYIKKIVEDPLLPISKYSHGSNIVAALLFLGGVFGGFWFFSYSVADDDLENKTHHAQKLQMFTNAMFWLGSCIVAATSGSTGFDSFFTKRGLEASKIKSESAGYKEIVAIMNDRHDRIQGFFALNQAIYKLRYLNTFIDLTGNSQVRTTALSEIKYNEYRKIEREISELGRCLKQDFGLPLIDDLVTERQLYTQIERVVVILKRRILDSEYFNLIFNRLKRMFKRQLTDLEFNTLLLKDARPLRSDLEDDVDIDYYTKWILLDIIGELACIMQPVGTHWALISILLFDDLQLKSVERPMREHLAEEMKKNSPLSQPNDLARETFVKKMIITLKKRMPGLMLEDEPPIRYPYLPFASQIRRTSAAYGIFTAIAGVQARGASAAAAQPVTYAYPLAGVGSGRVPRFTPTAMRGRAAGYGLSSRRSASTGIYSPRQYETRAAIYTTVHPDELPPLSPPPSSRFPP